MTVMLFIVGMIVLALLVAIFSEGTGTSPSRRVFPHSSKIHKPEDIIRLFDALDVKYVDSIVFSPEAMALRNRKADVLGLYRTFFDYHYLMTDRFGKYIEEKYKVKLFIEWVNDDVGYGLFADQDIGEGDYILEYTGEVLINATNSTWAWHYPLNIIEGQSKRISLDASSMGNEARFANHSLSPNIKAELVYDVNGIGHLVYIALHNIKEEEQLLINYGEGYWKNRESMVL
jgi:hypothetical protein